MGRMQTSLFRPEEKADAQLHFVLFRKWKERVQRLSESFPVFEHQGQDVGGETSCRTGNIAATAATLVRDGKVHDETRCGIWNSCLIRILL